MPREKKTIEPGFDIYGEECFVLYRSSQPDYWLPVTVKEAFDAVIEENNQNTDQIQRNMMSDFIKQEWESIPESNRNKPATLSGLVTRVGTDPAFPPIMKVNPLYWDKNKPESDIQFIYFQMITNRNFLEQRSREYLKANSISYHKVRFEESLDNSFVKSLMPLVVR